MAKNFFNHCDLDHSGVVSLQEFLEWEQQPTFKEFKELLMKDGQMQSFISEEMAMDTDSENTTQQMILEPQSSTTENVKQRMIE